jgi:hypothetical protein
MAPGYSVYNNMGSGYDVWATWNWWGTTSPTEIEALIFDQLDDASRGIVWYDPYLTEPISCTGLLALPDELAATVPQGAATVAALRLRNCTTMPLTYTLATEPAGWLAADAPGGVLAAGQVQTATFGLDAGDLAVGFHSGMVTIDHTAPGSPEIVPASLLVVGGGCGPLLGPWLETTPLPQPAAAPFENQHGQQLTVYGDHIYIFGGRNAADSRLTEVYYSPIHADGSLGTWTATTSLPGLYYDHVTLRVGDHVYLLTGAAGSTAVWYASLNPDGSLGAWAGTAPFDLSRQNFAAVAHGGHIYASGGNAVGTRDFVQFAAVNPNGTLGPWAYTTSLPEPLEGHTMVAHDGYLYVMARSGTVYYAAIQGGGGVGTWNTTAPMPGPMYGHASFVYNGYLYLLDGQSPAAYYALILDDHSLSPWQATAWRPAVRQAMRAGAQGCHVYAAGGFDGTLYQPTVYYADLQTLLSGVEIAGPARGLVETGYTFTATVSPPTATQPVYFDWQATGQPPIAAGNGTSATVTLAWTTPGTQVLTVTASNVASPVRDEHPICIYGPPQADFSATPQLGLTPLAVAFTDLSAGYLTAWAWDFGDGGSSDARHPTHTYGAAGSFTVTLTISGLGVSDTVVKPDYICVSRPTIYLPLVLRNY